MRDVLGGRHDYASGRGSADPGQTGRAPDDMPTACVGLTRRAATTHYRGLAKCQGLDRRFWLRRRGEIDRWPGQVGHRTGGQSFVALIGTRPGVHALSCSRREAGLGGVRADGRQRAGCGSATWARVAWMQADSRHTTRA